MTTYATVTQLNAYLPAAHAVDTEDDAAVAEAERLLERASEALDEIVRARYSVDDEGLPTDAILATVFAAATVRQYEHWIEVGEANAIDGLAGAQITTDGYSGPRAPKVGPRAVTVLRQAGMLDPVPWAEHYLSSAETELLP